MLNGEKLNGVEMVSALNKLGGENGIGLADLVENRLVGMKSRGVYETPGGAILYHAHEVLETITLEIIPPIIPSPQAIFLRRVPCFRLCTSFQTHHTPRVCVKKDILPRFRKPRLIYPATSRRCRSFALPRTR